MRRLHLRRVGLAALLALVLAGCGDATEDNPAPSDPTTTTSDVAPTSEDVTATDEATDNATNDAVESTAAGSGPVTGTATESASETAPEPATPTSLAPAPVETAAPPAADPAPENPVHGACTDDSMSEDILGFTGGVQVHFCESDWAFAVYPDAPDEPEFIAELSGGQWFHAVTIGDPVCQDDLANRGAPGAIAKLLPPCGEEPAPTTEPPAPTDPPAGPCAVETALYGTAKVELVGVSCAEATAEWQVAEANAEPSWSIPWVTPGGWECYVTPFDASSAAAGSCYGPDGSSYFTLYVP